MRTEGARIGIAESAVRVRNLRQLREAAFLTQAELAQKAGLTEATVSRIEHGHHEPRISTVRRLATALGVHPRELVDPSPKPD